MKLFETYSKIRRRNDSFVAVLMILCALLLTAGSAFAGTICGTVWDMATGERIQQAGVFVRTPDGAYTGYHGATDDLGDFCIDEIPPGTYDLEVRVDNYVTGYLRNVEVTDDATSVQIDLDVPVYFSQPWPNPAQDAVSFRFRSSPGVPARLLIYDSLGRLVHGWVDPSSTNGDREFRWDLRDRNGNRTPSGVYFARLLVQGRNLTRSFVVVK